MVFLIELYVIEKMAHSIPFHQNSKTFSTIYIEIFCCRNSVPRYPSNSPFYTHLIGYPQV